MATLWLRSQNVAKEKGAFINFAKFIIFGKTSHLPFSVRQSNIFWLPDFSVRQKNISSQFFILDIY
jgi:hypothetical protein